MTLSITIPVDENLYHNLYKIGRSFGTTPKWAALEILRRMAGHGFRQIEVDPATFQRIREQVEGGRVAKK